MAGIRARTPAWFINDNGHVTAEYMIHTVQRLGAADVEEGGIVLAGNVIAWVAAVGVLQTSDAERITDVEFIATVLRLAIFWSWVA